MWFSRRIRPVSQAPDVQPWLSRREAGYVKNYRTANSTATIDRIFVKDNGGSSWMECDYPNRHFFLHLMRRFEDLPRDWEEVTELALGLSGLNEEQCASIRAAVADEAIPGGCYILSIDREGYSFKDCVGNFRTVTIAEGSF